MFFSLSFKINALGNEWWASEATWEEGQWALHSLRSPEHFLTMMSQGLGGDPGGDPWRTVASSPGADDGPSQGERDLGCPSDRSPRRQLQEVIPGMSMGRQVLALVSHKLLSLVQRALSALPF